MSNSVAEDSQVNAFATQRFYQTQEIIQPRDRELGAPLPPLPPSFALFPEALSPAQAPVNPDEVEQAARTRAPFLLSGRSMPYMDDVIRASRLLRGKRSYIEVGIFDRGNLAYIASQLADDAIIIGVDVEAEPERDAMIQQAIKPTQQIHIVIGDSRDPATVAQVRSILGDTPAEAVFIDGGHDAFTVMHDYVNYGGLIAADGLVLFHDSLWEGSETYKGGADALCEIDRLDPVYLVAANWPVHRFMRPLWREPVWGVVGVIPMAGRYIAQAFGRP